MSETLGRCDKRQYEHCGLHPRYADVGQSLPPFACVNWQPETLEQRSERERNEALSKRDAAYISSDMDDFWGFGG